MMGATALLQRKGPVRFTSRIRAQRDRAASERAQFLRDRLAFVVALTVADRDLDTATRQRVANPPPQPTGSPRDDRRRILEVHACLIGE